MGQSIANLFGYRQQVNKHLNYATFQLQQVEKITQSIQFEGFFQSVAFQLHLACLFYYREIGFVSNIKQLERIRCLNDLSQLAMQQNIVVAELNELTSNQSWQQAEQVFQQIYLPSLNQALQGKNALNAAMKADSIIATEHSVDNTNNGKGLTKDTLASFLISIQELIQQQRELAIHN